LTQKVPKKSSHQECFFAAHGHCAQPIKNLGLQSFCPIAAHAQSRRYMQKVAMPCPPHCLAGFLSVLAEALLLTGKKLYVIFRAACIAP
jgi:hypothetical protein